MKIALVGDVMLGRLVNRALKSKSASYPWGNTLSILKEADLRICNLECVLTDFGEPWSQTPKMFHFRSDEKNIDVLQAANIEVVSLANNHVLDYGDEGLLRMLDILDSHKILYAGAGKNQQQACQPSISQVRGQKIALLAFTDNDPDWQAKEKLPGIFYLPVNIKNEKAQEFFHTIKILRQEVDFLIISAHWGPNWGYDPPKEHIAFAHALIDAGADLIFGHSGHIFRGIEIYKQKPIIYCAGDFIDDYAVDEVEKNDESFLFVIEITPTKKVKINLYPCYIHQFQANLASAYPAHTILTKMFDLCQSLGTPLTVSGPSATIVI